MYTPEVEADNPDDSTGAFLSKPFRPAQQHSHRELGLPLGHRSAILIFLSGLPQPERAAWATIDVHPN